MSLSGIQRSDSIIHILFQILFHDGLLRLKRLPPVRETQVRYLGREDPLEKEMAIHSSILAWRIPWTEKSMGSQRIGRDRATSPCLTLENSEQGSLCYTVAAGYLFYI